MLGRFVISTATYLIVCVPLSTSTSFFNDTATTEIYTLSLHDALPIFGLGDAPVRPGALAEDQRRVAQLVKEASRLDRKSTRLNSSHTVISYAVFCLKKKNGPGRSAAGCSRSEWPRRRRRARGAQT